MRYQLTMPTEPSGPYASSNSYTFELSNNFWLGLALCDTQSYPEVKQACKPDSDENIVDPAKDPGAVPGSAFYELQFYPPGWVTGCDATKWCAGVMINSWSQNAMNGKALNRTCQAEIMGGIEYTNYAFVTLDGKPLGPADPLHFDPTTSGNPVNADTLLLGQGDHVVVTISDTPSGVKAVVQDTTTGQSGSMVASAANGFGQIQFAPGGTGCTELPYDFHPMYSTSTPRTRILWAAHTTNVTFTDEIGHFDFCTQITFEGGSCNGLEGMPGDQKPADGDDNSCFDAGASPNYPVVGCGSDNVPGFDGPSYQLDWPDGSSGRPTPVTFTSPLTGPGYTTQYSQAGFETNLPVTESPLNTGTGSCDLATGAECVNPPNTDDGTPAAFYPYFSALTGSGCQWEIGNFPSAANVNDFGQDAEFGAVTPSVYYSPPFGASHGHTANVYSDFRSILPDNPC
jgi:hypothetical protein